MTALDKSAATTCTIDPSVGGPCHQFLVITRAVKDSFHLSTFTLPTLLAMLAALFEGITFALLVPTTESILKNDYSAVRALPVLRDLFSFFVSNWESTDRRFGLIVVICILGTTVCKNVFQYLSTSASSYRIKCFAHEVRCRIYSRYLQFGKAFFDSMNAGKIQQIPTLYVQQLSRCVSSLSNGIYAACTLITYLSILLYLSWQLTLIVLLLFPILHVSLRRLIARISRSSSEEVAATNTLVKSISNMLGTISLVKLAGTEHTELSRFENQSRCAALMEYSVEKKYLLIFPLQEVVLVSFLLLLLIGMGSIYSLTEPTEIAELVVFFLVLKRAAMLFSLFNNVRASLAATAGPIAEISDIFSDEGKYISVDGTLPFRGLNHEIRVNDLSYCYAAGQVALHKVNVTIPARQFTAIVGHTGSGKSTLVNLLIRLYDPPAAAIFIDDQDITSFSVSSLRAGIAVVTQECALFDATIRENILYGMTRPISTERLMQALDAAQLLETVNQLPDGLDTLVGDRGVQLSGGERQRISIARAILKESRIIILDEATSALDATTERTVRGALLASHESCTIIAIAHRLSTVQDADKIIVLEHGKVTESGTFSELLAARGALFRYWSDHIHSETDDLERQEI